MSHVAHQALGVFLLLPEWVASPLQGDLQHYIHWYPFIHLGGERHPESSAFLSKNKTQFSWPGLKLRLLNPEVNILTVRPHCLHHGISHKSLEFSWYAHTILGQCVYSKNIHSSGK